MQHPPSHVFFNTARPEGHQISRMWTELEEGGSTARRQHEELLRWQQVSGCRARWSESRTAAATVPKVPYRPDSETSERTRGIRGHPHKGDSLSPYSLRGGAIFRPEEGLGTGGAKRDTGNRPPTDRRILAPNLRIPNSGSRSDKSWSRRGEAEGDMTARVAARGRSSQSGYMVGSRRSSAAVLPRGGCQEQARVFSCGFPHLV